MKIGDTVRVVNPEMVTRIGYNETLESAKQKMLDEFAHNHEISMYEFFNKHFKFSSSTGEYVDKLALEYNRNVLRFGGPQRKIFTQTCPQYQGKMATIVSRIVRQTGMFERGGGEIGNALVGQQSHVLFELRFHEDIEEPYVRETTWPPNQAYLDLVNNSYLDTSINMSYYGKVYDKTSGRRFNNLIEKRNLEWVAPSSP